MGQPAVGHADPQTAGAPAKGRTAAPPEGVSDGRSAKEGLPPPAAKGQAASAPTAKTGEAAAGRQEPCPRPEAAQAEASP